MKIRQVALPDHQVIGPTEDGVPVIPIVIPELEDIVHLAYGFHAKSQPWQGIAFGWQASYHPGDSMYATFDIGVNSLFFVSINWEFGSAERPHVYCEDDYGYDPLPEDLAINDLRQAIADASSDE